jgi:hypothetical protein
MAVGHRDIPVTREDVYKWLEEWKKMPKKDKPSKEQHIIDKLEKAGHGDTELNVELRDDIPGNSIPLWQVVVNDLDSYG